MPNGTLRLIQASDFHLERPLHGVAEVPSHLRDLFLDAPFTAAEQIFAAAVAKQVDLVVLAGDIVDTRRADPRAVVFLERQFQRLAEHGIQVYWAGGPDDAVSQWRKSGAVAQNVHLLATNTVEEQVYHRNEEPAARIIGFSCGRGGKLKVRARRDRRSGLLTIGIGYGSGAIAPLADLKADFIAVGGHHLHEEQAGERCRVLYAGTPQGRTPQEPGAHGCSLVAIDTSGGVAVTPVSTDVARWVDVQIGIESAIDRGAIQQQLDRAMAGQIAAARGVDLLISWRLTGKTEPIRRELCRGDLAAELLTDLRARYGHTSPAAWSVSVTADPPDPPVADDFDPETILGGFLRVAGKYRTQRSAPLELSELLPKRLLDEPLVAVSAKLRGEDRRCLVDEAVRLGIDLLGG